MKYKAIIFDLDGTIVNTNGIWSQVISDLLTEKGIILTDDININIELKTKGIAIPQSCAIIKEMFNLTHSIEELIHEKRERACALYLDKLSFIDGFQKFHQAVIENNIKIGIATNSEDKTLGIVINKLKLDQLFGTHIYNISHVNNKGKPAPDIYIHAAKQLNIDPEYCLAIEDSPHGITAAKAAGMFCVGINSAGNATELHNADIIVNTYDEINLENLLKRIKNKSSIQSSYITPDKLKK